MNETVICPKCKLPLPDGAEPYLTIGRWHPACCPHIAVFLMGREPTIWSCAQCDSDVSPIHGEDGERTGWEVLD